MAIITPRSQFALTAGASGLGFCAEKGGSCLIIQYRETIDLFSANVYIEESFEIHWVLMHTNLKLRCLDFKLHNYICIETFAQMPYYCSPMT